MDVDDQNREDEPPVFGSHAQEYMEEDEEYEAPEDDYMPPEPPMRSGGMKAIEDDDLPFD